LIGVVIAAFNAEPFIEQTLASLTAQSLGDWRCVVVDDGSSDATGELVAAFAAGEPRITLRAVANGGHGRARNLAIELLGDSVDAITVMDADDVWLPHALALLDERLRARPDCIGAHALGDFIDERGRREESGEFAAFGRRRLSGASGRLREVPLEADSSFATIITASTIFPPGVLLLRRAVYAQIGGYDVRSVEGDWDLQIRAARLGPIAFVNEVVVLYRRHGANFGARPEIELSTHESLWRAHRSALNSPAQRALLRACWRARQRAAASRRLGELSGARSARDRAIAAARLGLALARYVRGRPGLPLRTRFARAPR
jgi:glycosyltransferase involved in cell wall biosynthesis